METDKAAKSLPDPANLQNALGRRVRRLRAERRLTLEEVGQKSGCSVGLLSQLERGRANPSFFTLVKIAHALDIPVARLFDEQKNVSPVVRHGHGRRLNPHPHGVGKETLYELLTPDLDRSLEVIRVEEPPGMSTEETPLIHPGEEVGIILRGIEEVHVNGVTYILHAGDAISYPSTAPHWYRNPGTEVMEAIWIITPPTF